ncbi:MAG: hypothetical protein ACI89E_002101 [Planctomycetota bacterium]|jgi:hypothetical protein
MHKSQLLIIFLLALLSSCASIVSDSDYPVTFNTEPAGGAISITNENGTHVYEGSTPTTINLEAGNGYFNGETYTVIASLEGFDPVTATLDSTMDGWFIGNLIFGGLLGILIIDPATGAMWKLEDTFTVNMDPNANPPEEEMDASASVAIN